MTIEITKISVKKAQEGMYYITLRMRYLNGTTELINQEFGTKHKIGNSIEQSINKIKMEMQKAINDYKEEQTIYNSGRLNSIISTLQSSLTL